jgi:hypothetical protein
MAKLPKDEPKLNDARYSRKNLSTGDSYQTSRVYSHKSVQDAITKEFPIWSEFGSHQKPYRYGRPRNSVYRAYQLYLQQSEFKKPYLHTSYPEMEYGFDLPGRPRIFSADIPDVPDPWRPETIIPEPGALIVFDLNCNSEDEEASDCDTGDCGFCPNDTVFVQLSCSEPCYHVQVSLTDDPATKLTNIKGYGTNTVSFDLEAGNEAGFITIEASMTSVEGVTGTSNVNLPECDTCFEFAIRAIRDDGTIIDDTYISPGNVKCFKSTGAPQFISTPVYQNGRWRFNLQSPKDPTNKYFVRIDNVDGGDSGINTVQFNTQYPNKYKVADYFQAADKIEPGEYTINIPYFNWVTDWDFTGEPPTDIGTMPAPANCFSGVPAAGTFFIASLTSGSNLYHHTNAVGTYRFEAEIEASINYNIRVYSRGTIRRLYGTMLASDPTQDPGCNITPGSCHNTGFYHTDGTCTDFPQPIDSDLCTVADVASDGLAGYSASGTAGTTAKYDENINVVGSIGGKTHYIETTISGHAGGYWLCRLSSPTPCVSAYPTYTFANMTKVGISASSCWMELDVTII